MSGDVFVVVIVQVPAFIMSILIGGYSDSAGRKVAMVLPLVCTSVRLFLLIIIAFFDLHIGFLIPANMCEGFGGGITTLLMASFSYISNITSSRNRSTRIVLVELTMSVAGVSSFLYVGYAIKLFGYVWIFVAFLGLMFIGLCYVVFILQEVRPTSANPTDKAHLLTTEHFKRVLALYLKDDAEGSGRHWKLRFTFLVMAITIALQYGYVDIQTFFMLSPPLCFNSVWIGYFFAAALAVKILTTLVVTHIFVRYTGDLILIVVGLLFGIGDQLNFGLSTTRVMLFAGQYIRYFIVSSEMVHAENCRQFRTAEQNAHIILLILILSDFSYEHEHTIFYLFLFNQPFFWGHQSHLTMDRINGLMDY